MSNKTQVVIIGAGQAGLRIAKELDTKLNPANAEVILISSRDYYLSIPASLRPTVTSEVGPQFVGRMATPYDRAFGKDKKGGQGRVSRIKVGAVSSIEERSDGSGGKVHLQSGETIPWDYLVISTGSAWNGPLLWPNKKSEVDSHLSRWRARYDKAKSVLVVGGGAAGSELAGEIADFHPHMKITVVHSQPKLINEAYPDKFRNAAGNGLTTRGVRLILNDRVELTQDTLDGQDEVVPGRRVTTSKGVEVDAELIIPFTGARRAATDFLQPSASPLATKISGSLGAQGHLKVLPTLQLQTNSRVFAAGDVIDWPEEHTAMKCMAHAPLVTANIITLINGRGALKNYSSSAEIMVLTNGRYRGVGILYLVPSWGWSILLGNWLTSNIKGKTLLTGLTASLLNSE